jgi:hypothetical protein
MCEASVLTRLTILTRLSKKQTLCQSPRLASKRLYKHLSTNPLNRMMRCREICAVSGMESLAIPTVVTYSDDWSAVQLARRAALNAGSIPAGSRKSELNQNGHLGFDPVRNRVGYCDFGRFYLALWERLVILPVSMGAKPRARYAASNPSSPTSVRLLTGTRDVHVSYCYLAV